MRRSTCGLSRAHECISWSELNRTELLFLAEYTHHGDYDWFWVLGRCYGVSRQAMTWHDMMARCPIPATTDTLDVLRHMAYYLQSTLRSTEHYWIGACQGKGFRYVGGRLKAFSDVATSSLRRHLRLLHQHLKIVGDQSYSSLAILKC